MLSLRQDGAVGDGDGARQAGLVDGVGRDQVGRDGESAREPPPRWTGDDSERPAGGLARLSPRPAQTGAAERSAPATSAPVPVI
jgi:hypothetical protein